MKNLGYSFAALSISFLALAADSSSRQKQLPTEELRTTMVRCARGLGMEQPSGDIAALSQNPGTKEVSMFLFHEKGVYAFPLASTDFKNGSIKLRARFLNDSNRPETLMITGSYENNDLANSSLIVRKIDPENLTPDVLKYMNDIPEEKFATKPVLGERHFLENTLLPFMLMPAQATNVQQRMNFLTSYFPMDSISKDPLWVKQSTDAKKLAEKDPGKGNEEFTVAMIQAFARAAKNAATEHGSRVESALSDIKACDDLDPKALRIVAKAATTLLTDAKNGNKTIPDRLHKLVNDHVLEDQISKTDTYEDIKGLEKNVQRYSRTAFQKMTNDEMKIQKVLRSGSKGHATDGKAEEENH